jgi:peptide deformylase
MIIINDEMALRKPCEDVLESEVNDLIDKLQAELNEANRLGRGGIGLAAPQIGIYKRAAIVRLGDVSLNLINAKIEKSFDPTRFIQEGCLSFPGRIEDTTRYQEVYITNNLVYPHSFIAVGLIAVICQHEIDHLNSSLFFDRAIAKQQTISGIKTKLGPNDLCSCGSGKKFKKCCGKK